MNNDHEATILKNFKPGDKVCLRRHDGLETGWEYACCDPDTRRTILVKLEPAVGRILHKTIPWDEFLALNPVHVRPGDKVAVRRTTGDIEKDWGFAGRNPETKNAVVVRPESDGNLLMKEIPWAEFLALNPAL